MENSFSFLLDFLPPPFFSRTNRLARPDYYSVRCLIFFLQNFTSQSEYESYLDAAIQESEFVRFQDAEPLWHFFTGGENILIKIELS